MKWKGRQQSSNVEDRRGTSMKKVGGGIGIGTIILIGLALFFADDPQSAISEITRNAQQGQVQTQQTGQTSAADDELAAFVKTVLNDTETVWAKLFPEQLGRNYSPPVLVLFTGQVSSACGYASAASGPFYCPGDQKLYIDLAFYQQLKTRFKAPGDFAMAYVVAHEVAHHIQNQLGIMDQVNQQRRRLPKEEFNKVSVRLELQADFLSGVWARHAHQMMDILEEGDIEEAMNAARAIGDDMIQKRSQGYVIPESFTHGTSEQRMRWFRKGLETGDMTQGDTFNQAI